jgi:nucleoside-diphosphate-sugar epimerase
MPTYAITGANGFIAAHCAPTGETEPISTMNSTHPPTRSPVPAVIKHLIAEGHNVIGTVRDASKCDKVASLGAKLVEVKSIDDASALESAFKGCDGVFHMAAVHPEYGFEATPEGRDGMLKAAVNGTTTVVGAAKAAGVKRVVLTSSLAAVECGNDQGTLSESTWSKPEVYDAAEKLEGTQWTTHYSYVKSKVEQEKAGVAEAKKLGLDLRVVVPGNLVVGPVESSNINGTMTRVRDIVTGTNTLKGAADLAIVHVADVVNAHAKCMLDDGASGRYIVAQDMVKIEDVFAALKEMYPDLPVADLVDQDIASGVVGSARKIDSRVSSLGIELTPFKTALKDAVDSMIANKLVATGA